MSEENKGLIWTLLKQLRPGMDLSKVVLPTFILEPRSFLDKLSDYYFHADLLSQSVPHTRPLTPHVQARSSYSKSNYLPKRNTRSVTLCRSDIKRILGLPISKCLPKSCSHV